MCGIFAAKNFKTYTKLYNKNKERGSFSYGGLFLSHEYDAAIKKEGTVSLSEQMMIENGDIRMKTNSFYYFLGHTQAPTSSARHYDEETTHPFHCGSWVVAHNGVLTNDDKLKKTIKDASKYNEVDTSVIPALLDKFSEETGQNEVDIVTDVLSKLQGTFGLWIYNKDTHNVYIARSGSTIYADMLQNSFSSLPEDGFTPLEEGVLYLVTQEGITSVGGFSKNSPFFII